MNKHITSARRKARKRQRREGIVLLITAFVLLIVSGTAMFAIQQGVWEMRAAGTTLQAMRTRYVAESFVMAGLSCIEAKATCLAPKNAADVWRAKYGVPAPVGTPTEERFEIRPVDLGVVNGFVSEVVQDDATMSGGGMATVFEPNFRYIVESWMLAEPEPGKPTPTRYVASCYGELAVPNDASSGGNRGVNETISITRAYYGN